MGGQNGGYPQRCHVAKASVGEVRKGLQQWQIGVAIRLIKPFFAHRPVPMPENPWEVAVENKTNLTPWLARYVIICHPRTLVRALWSGAKSYSWVT